MINTFSSNHDIVRLFCSFQQSSAKYLVIIHLKEHIIFREDLQTKWIRKAFEQCDTHIIMFGEVDPIYHIRLITLQETIELYSMKFNEKIKALRKASGMN